MKTAVVISDTHGNMRGLDKLNGVFAECDYIIHLGDTSSDGARIKLDFPNKTILINGNCDFTKSGSDEKIIQIENCKIFCTHGHLYSAKSTLSKLAARAKELDCKVALYGHTHAAREDEIDGVLLINPGNMTRYSTVWGYCYLVINGDKATGKLVEIRNDG